LLVLAAACHRATPHEEAPPGASAAGTAPSVAPAGGAPGMSLGGAAVAPVGGAPGCALAPLPLRLPAPPRLVAIGDLHGDLAAARAALRAAGAIDDRDRWVGGALVVVQTGDVLDRGDDEHAILDLIGRLEIEARAAGGAFIELLGNHELMNAAGDLRYVTPAGLHDFDGAPAPAAAASAGAPAGMRSRLAALGAGGSYARRLAQHAVIAIVGDTVFSHAGVLGSWVGRVDEVNRTTRCWLDGQASQPPVALTADDGPVWTRAAGTPSVDCAAVTEALAGLGVQRMVVGHTVQGQGITSACGEALWRIDVGLSRHYGGPIEVLELTPGAPGKVLTGARG